MASEQFTNGATTTLNGSVSSGATTLTVTSTTGFPAIPQFRVRVGSELMLVTALSGTSWTVVRGIEGTNAAAQPSGAGVTQVLTAGALTAAAFTTNLLVNPFRAYSRQTRTTLTGFATNDYSLDVWYLQHDAGSTNLQIRGWQPSDTSPPFSFGTLGSASYAQIKNNAGSAAGWLLCQPVEQAGPDGVSTVEVRGLPLTLQVAAVASAGTPTLRVAVFEWTGTADAPSKLVASWSGGHVPTFNTTNLTQLGSASRTLDASTWGDVSTTVTAGTSCNNLFAAIWAENVASGTSIYLAKPWLGRGAAPVVWAPHPSDDALTKRYFRTVVPFGSIVSGTMVSGTMFRHAVPVGPNEMRTTPTAVFPAASWVTGTPTGSNVAWFSNTSGVFASLTGGSSTFAGIVELYTFRIDATSGTFGTATVRDQGALLLGPNAFVGYKAEIALS